MPWSPENARTTRTELLRLVGVVRQERTAKATCQLPLSQISTSYGSSLGGLPARGTGFSCLEIR